MPAECPSYHASEFAPKPRIYGRLLVSGDVILASDVYESTSGEWLPAPCPGTTLQGTLTRWVRPEPEQEPVPAPQRAEEPEPAE